MRNKTSKHHIYMASLMICCVGLLVACGNDATATPSATLAPVATVIPPESDWGNVTLVSQAESLSAPAFRYLGDEPLFIWTGSDNESAQIFSRGIDSASSDMNLIAFFPQQQQVFPVNRATLMLWLDRTVDTLDLQLLAATVNNEGTFIEGTVPVSDQRTRNYDAVVINDRNVRAVWSGGVGQVTNLYLHQIDNFGRPVGGDLLRRDGDHPALIVDNEGVVHLFWLENNGREVFHAQFDEIGAPTLTNIERIATTNFSATDTITHFTAGYDGEHVYLFWNVRRIDTRRLVLMSSGTLARTDFTQPTQLQTAESDAIHWLTLSNETLYPLPAVVNSDEALMLMTFADGIAQENEWIVTSGQLIGLPSLALTSTQIGVSWAEPSATGYANLWYVSRSLVAD